MSKNYSVGNGTFPEHVIQGVELSEKGATIWYDLDGESLVYSVAVLNPFARQDLRELVASHPELLRENGVQVVQVIESTNVPTTFTPARTDGYAVYYNGMEQIGPEIRDIYENFDKAKAAVHSAVHSGFEKGGVIHAWKGTIYSLSSEHQPGSQFGKSDLSKCLYSQEKS